jgi:hypothetical protein
MDIFLFPIFKWPFCQKNELLKHLESLEVTLIQPGKKSEPNIL